MTKNNDGIKDLLPSPLKKRSIWLESPSQIRQILDALKGETPPTSYKAEEGHQGGSWVFALLLGAMASMWVHWLSRDLFGNDTAPTYRLLLSILTFVATVILFYILKTNEDTYEFDKLAIRCFEKNRSGKDKLRWQITRSEIVAIHLFSVRYHRYFITLHTDLGKKLSIHSHESLARVLRKQRL